MTAATRTRGILALAWPLVLSFWMRSLFTFVDSLYAAKLGDSAVAGLGLATPYEFLRIALWVGASTGMTSLLSRAIGAREDDRARQVIRTTERIIFVLVPSYGLLGLLIWLHPAAFAQPFGSHGHPLEPATLQAFRVYGSVIVAGTALTTFWSVIPDSIVKAHHDTHATMWAGIWSNVVNVILNTIFLFVFHWGMFGIAFSTVVGSLAGLAYALRAAAAHERRRLGTEHETAPGISSTPLGDQLALALPAAVAFVLVGLESAIVNHLLGRTGSSTQALAAYSVTSRYVSFCVMPLIATAVAILPYTARLRGQGDFAGIRRAFREVTLAGVSYVLLLVLPVTVLFSGPLVRAFAQGEETRALAAFGVRLVALSCLATGPFFLCRPIFEGLQLGRPGLTIAALRYLLLTPLFGLAGCLVAEQVGAPPFQGLVLGLISAGAVSSAIFLVWMLRTLSRLEREAG